MRRRHCRVVAVILIGVAGATIAAQESKPREPLPKQEVRERNLRTYAELMRSDIRSQKVAIVTEMLLLTEAEDVKFWPIYREYEFELSRIYDDRMKLIDTYGEKYTKLTDAEAEDLALGSLALEARRTALKQQYFNRLKGELSPRLATRALHVEHQLELLVDLQIAAALPVATPK